MDKEKMLERAKEIFYICYGNSFVIQREYGREYYKYKIPEEYENEWKNEIIEKLEHAIKESIGKERYLYFLKICDLISKEKSIKLTIDLLNCNLDCFERLLYSEYLKKMNTKVSDSKLCDEILKNKIILESNIDLVKKHSREYLIQDVDIINERIKKL